MRRHSPLPPILGGLLLLAFLFPLSVSAAETRGVKRVEIKTTAGEAIGLYEQSHALVIGVSDYTNGWPKLPGVKKDVKAVVATLKQQGFRVTLVNNPKDRRALEDAFTRFIDRYGLKPGNRLLFYFSGHGHTEKTTYGDEMGYIVPASAPNPRRDKQGFLQNAMDMQIIEVYAKRIQSKHALFVFDSCFSGALFALSRAVPESINAKTAQPVRQFITSGSAEETVPDQSIFREQFIAGLQGEADLNQDRYVTGAELGEFLYDSVVNYSKGAQHPQYGKIRHPKLDKGDFVFQLTRIELPQAPSENTFSLQDLDREAQQQQEQKRKEVALQQAWAEKLKEMQAAFQQVTTYEQQDITPDLKVKAWRRFATAFAEDNPYSSKDESLRKHGQARIVYWLSRKRQTLTPEDQRKLLDSIHYRLLKAKDLGLPAIRDPRVKQLISSVFFGVRESRPERVYQLQLISEAPAILKEIKNRGDLILQIEGHADWSEGEEEENLELGHKRAKVVHHLLKGFVTDPALLRTISFGEEFPADPSSSDEARAKNRRVDFTILLK